MKYIQLTKNMKAIVDDDMFDELSKYDWYFDSRGYAMRATRKNGKTIFIAMHRVVNGTADGLMTDHINHNRLDNRRSNLRSCTRSENVCNAKFISNSGHKGIHLTKNGTYQTKVQKDGVVHYLGTFKTVKEAKNARKEAVMRLHGEFAYM